METETEEWWMNDGQDAVDGQVPTAYPVLFIDKNQRLFAGLLLLYQENGK